MLAITLALTLSGAFTDDLDGPSFRLYEAHAGFCLDAWEADPTLRDAGGPFEDVGLGVLSYGDNNAEVCAVVERARAMGVQAHPGLRTYLSYPIEYVVTKAHWDTLASQLYALTLCAEGRVQLDVEDYAPTVRVTQAYIDSAGITLAELHSRMSNFLNLVKTMTHVGVYPADPGDLVHVAILDAAGAGGEVWEERTFGSVYGAMRGQSHWDYALLKRMRATVDYGRAWPGVRVRSGLFDSLFRDDGHQARLRIDDHGPLQPWAFRNYRGDSDGGVMCSAQWVASTVYDSRNDIHQVFSIANGGDRPLTAAPVDGYRNTLRKYRGGLASGPFEPSVDGFYGIPEGEQLENTTALTGDLSYTVAATLRIKSQGPGRKVIFGRFRAIGSGDQNLWSITAEESAPWGQSAPTDGGVADGGADAGPLVDGPQTFDLVLHGANFTDPQPLGQVEVGEAFRITARWDRPAAILTAHVIDEDGNQCATTTGQASAAYDTYTLIGIQPDNIQNPNGVLEISGQYVTAQRAWTDDEITRSTVGADWPWGR